MGTENDGNSDDNSSRRPTVDNDDVRRKLECPRSKLQMNLFPQGARRTGSSNKRQHSDRNESKTNLKKDDAATGEFTISQTSIRSLLD